jgi:hypothetical protein
LPQICHKPKRIEKDNGGISAGYRAHKNVAKNTEIRQIMKINFR